MPLVSSTMQDPVILQLEPNDTIMMHTPPISRNSPE